ncbi:MAG: calcium-binding protein [Solirubrobacterales bacterium]
MRRTVAWVSTRRKVLSVAASAGALSLCVGVALAASVSCDGGGVECTGTNNPDEITGSSERDVIFAKKGNDGVNARDGRDDVFGQGGSDLAELDGGNGDDRIYGGVGRDLLRELDTSGRDEMYGEEGDDFLIAGGLEGDFLYGGPGDEQFGPTTPGMYGDEGADRIYGGPGNDGIEGEEGVDRMFGGRGNDYIDAVTDDPGDTEDIVRCGRGNDDTVIYDPAEDDVDLDSCENQVP